MFATIVMVVGPVIAGVFAFECMMSMRRADDRREQLRQIREDLRF